MIPMTPMGAPFCGPFKHCFGVLRGDYLRDGFGFCDGGCPSVQKLADRPRCLHLCAKSCVTFRCCCRFFWYFAVLQPLPGPRQSLEMAESFFINNRGLYAPAPVADDGFSAVVIVFDRDCRHHHSSRWARKRQEATGQQFPVYGALGLIIGLPVVVFLLLGAPCYGIRRP